tara:strand:+ start:743 stop:1240 length:498 start_codon:yes stop_codon:yes gene_type:complete
MTRSANEVMVLAGKAARGAGAPPAQASEFGRAAVRHIHAGRDPSDISRALEAVPNGPIMDFPIAFARVFERGGDTPCGQVDASTWLPLAESYADALPYAVQVDVVGEVLNITVDLQCPAAKAHLGRLTLPDALFDQMTTFAARILVPESDASRLAGAGAGLTDND